MPKKSRQRRKETNLKHSPGDGKPSRAGGSAPSSGISSAPLSSRRTERTETARAAAKRRVDAPELPTAASDGARERELTPAKNKADRDASFKERPAQSNRTLFIGLAAIALVGAATWVWYRGSAPAASPAPSASTSSVAGKPTPPASTGGRVLAPAPAETGVDPQKQPTLVPTPSASSAAPAVASVIPVQPSNTGIPDTAAPSPLPAAEPQKPVKPKVTPKPKPATPPSPEFPY